MGSPSGRCDIEGYPRIGMVRDSVRLIFKQVSGLAGNLGQHPIFLGAEDLGAEDREMAINNFITDSAFFAQK